MEESIGLLEAVDLGKISCPTKVIGGDPTVPSSFLPCVDLADVLALDYDFVPDTSHFLVLEKPRECVDLMLGFLEHEGLIPSI